ncbi:MAG: fused MFS/spermidine synthase [Verrucomicrobiae bacterium]|nr:fused MFS/spermidine synthase [Verrucomicrobiae bacterium]
MKKFLPAIIAGILLVAANVALIFLAPDWVRETRQVQLHGEVIHEATSAFAHLRVREKGSVRSLMFVESDGTELMQSRIDLEKPEHLELRYSRAMFVSFLFRPNQQRVLIVGLGGGGMVRFLNAAMPETRVDAVEIDPAVVSAAAEFFGTENGPRTTIHTADAFEYLGDPAGPKYDVIYMDAFLRPPVEEGAAELVEKAQRLKTAAFLEQIRARLVKEPGGLVAFNLIEREPSTPDDLAAIRSVFPSVYEFPVAQTGNLVVIASTEAERVSAEELGKRAAELEAETEWAREIELRKVVAGLRE